MGYETRMYIGSPSEGVTTNGKRAVLTDDYVGNPSGSVFSIYSDENGEFFYLLDGNTRINLKCAQEAGVVKVLPATERQYFSQFFVLNLSKVGSIPEGRLTEEDIICDTPELGDFIIDGENYIAMFTEDKINEFMQSWVRDQVEKNEDW